MKYKTQSVGNQDVNCFQCKKNITVEEGYHHCYVDHKDFHKECVSYLNVHKVPYTSKEAQRERKKEVSKQLESMLLKQVNNYFIKLDHWKKLISNIVREPYVHKLN